MKPITCVLAEDATATWKLVLRWDLGQVYVGTGLPPYRRISVDELLSLEPADALQAEARHKLMSMILDAICNN